ncbi:MAG: hypothetical protein M0P38_08815, partial [Bacteroidales bacterium]|nr:hypothetical protein [Bacteroidales bacterium]
GLNVTNESIVVARPLAGVYTYEITVLDANGCDAVAETDVIVDSLPAVPQLTATDNIICLSAANATLTIESPVGVGYSYSLNGDAFQDTTNVYSNLTEGTYTIVVQTQEGCEATSQITINRDDTTPIVLIDPIIAILCPNIGTQDVTAQITSGLAPFVVNWSGAGFVATDSLTASLLLDRMQCDTTYEVHIEIEDAHGCFASDTLVINVNDTVKPTISDVATETHIAGCSVADAPVIITDEAGLTAIGMTIADNCSTSDSLDIHCDEVITGTCPINITRYYFVVDECGNVSDSAIHHILINDQEIPQMSDTTVMLTLNGCDASAAPFVATNPADLQALGFNFTDNCTSINNLTVSVTADTAGHCPIVIVRHYQVTDECGNISADAHHEIHIFDSVAPIIAGAIQDTFIDGCNLTALTAYPTANTVTELLAIGGMTITENCTSLNQLVVHSTADTSGRCPIMIVRTYTVEDECGNISNAVTENIFIQDTTSPVFTDIIADQMLGSANCDFTVPDFTDTVRTRISDNCNNANEIDISQLPVAGTIVTANSQVQITITDSCGNSAMMNVNILVPEPLQVSIIPDVSQFCENDSVTMTATVTGGTAGFTYDWQPINGLNVTNQSIVVARPTAGVYTYQLTVLDANGCNAVATSVVTVDSLPMAPVVSSTPNTICVGTQNGTIIIENPLGTGYSYSLNGAAFQDTTTVYDNLSVGNYTIIAQTAEGCSSTQTMTSIQNSQDLPTVVIHPNDMILCPNLGTQTVTAEILNGEAPFTVAWNTNQMISSDSLTAILGFLPQFCDTNYIFSVDVTDANNCSASAEDTLHVADNELPTITGTIAVTTINGCTENDAPAAVTTPAELIALGLQLNDNCTAINNLTVHSQDQVAGHCPIVITRTYQVEDECGNVSADFVQTLQVFDSVAPLMNNVTITLNLNGCDASVAPAVATTPSELTAIGFTFSDNCTANNDLTVEVVADTTGNCPMVLTRSYSVVDECGNESTAAIHEILIFDSVAPVINGFIADIFVDGCDTTVLRNHPIAATAAELLALDAISITELCTQTANLIVHSQEDTSGNCPIQVTRTYNVEDECGN